MYSQFSVYSGDPIYPLGTPIAIVALKVVPEANAILAEWCLYVVAPGNKVFNATYGRTPITLSEEEVTLGLKIDEPFVLITQEGALAKAEAMLTTVKEQEYAKTKEVATLHPTTFREEKKPDAYLQKLWIHGLLTKHLADLRATTKCEALKESLGKVVSIRQFFAVDDPKADVG